MAIVAEISFIFILAQQILLCSGDGSPGSPLYEVDVILLLPTSKLQKHILTCKRTSVEAEPSSLSKVSTYCLRERSPKAVWAM